MSASLPLYGAWWPAMSASSFCEPGTGVAWRMELGKSELLPYHSVWPVPSGFITMSGWR